MRQTIYNVPLCSLRFRYSYHIQRYSLPMLSNQQFHPARERARERAISRDRFSSRDWSPSLMRTRSSMIFRSRSLFYLTVQHHDVRSIIVCPGPVVVEFNEEIVTWVAAQSKQPLWERAGNRVERRRPSSRPHPAWTFVRGTSSGS